MKTNILLFALILLSCNLKAQEKETTTNDTVPKVRIGGPTTAFILIDGKESSFEDIDASKIKHLSIIHYLTFTMKNGETIKGVVYINTQEDMPYFNAEIPVKDIKTVSCFGGFVVLNGKTSYSMELLNFANVKSITVSFSEENVRKYGEAAKNGVIFIKGKKIKNE